MSRELSIVRASFLGRQHLRRSFKTPLNTRLQIKVLREHTSHAHTAMQHTHLNPTPATSALVTSPPASAWEDQVWQEKDRFWGFSSPHECNWGEFWRESQGHSLFRRTLRVTCQDPTTWGLSTTTHKSPHKQPGHTKQRVY